MLLDLGISRTVLKMLWLWSQVKAVAEEKTRLAGLSRRGVPKAKAKKVITPVDNEPTDEESAVEQQGERYWPSLVFVISF